MAPWGDAPAGTVKTNEPVAQSPVDLSATTSSWVEEPVIDQTRRLGSLMRQVNWGSSVWNPVSGSVSCWAGAPGGGVWVVTGASVTA